jgi:DNA-binding HxlR family transcriptional regulator
METKARKTKIAEAGYDLMQVNCPTRQVLGLVADKWTTLVVMALEDGTLRFSQLRARIGGVTQKMLTQTLRALERDGIVTRRVYPTVPVTVEYTLTDLGKSLSKSVDVIRRWAYANMAAIEGARRSYDRRMKEDR